MKILLGDILQSKAQTLINTVNTVGIMGKGIALEFKNRFPDMFKDYLQKCQRGEVRPGMPYLFRSLLPPQIVNFPTKDHWKSVSKISDIENGLQILVNEYKKWGITSLAIPPLGCGNGQLTWREVGPLIYRHARLMDIPIELYAPFGSHPKELTKDFLEKDLVEIGPRDVKVPAGGKDAWIALVAILDQIEKQPYHWAIGRTIFQKIAYMATRGGLPTGLEYARGSYGPFSNELKSVEAYLVNNNLLQEERAGRMFMVKVGPGFDRIRIKHDAAITKWMPILDKTADLFMRTNTDQAEIVATVVFAADELEEKTHSAPLEIEILESVLQWKQKRKPPLSKDEIASAIRHLAMLGFINAIPNSGVPDDAIAI